LKQLILISFNAKLIRLSSRLYASIRIQIQYGMLKGLGRMMKPNRTFKLHIKVGPVASLGAVARLVGIEGGVVSGVFNLESPGVEAPDWRPRYGKQYHEV
jgi:hypothetical protein